MDGHLIGSVTFPMNPHVRLCLMDGWSVGFKGQESYTSNAPIKYSNGLNILKSFSYNICAEDCCQSFIFIGQAG